MYDWLPLIFSGELVYARRSSPKSPPREVQIWKSVILQFLWSWLDLSKWVKAEKIELLECLPSTCRFQVNLIKDRQFETQLWFQDQKFIKWPPKPNILSWFSTRRYKKKFNPPQYIVEQWQFNLTESKSHQGHQWIHNLYSQYNYCCFFFAFMRM